MVKRKGVAGRPKRSARRTPGKSPSAGPQRPREGRVVGIQRSRSDGQQLEVEDEAGMRWQVDCLGEAVQEGSQVRFEARAAGPERRGVLVRVIDEARESWVCTVRRDGKVLGLVPFGGLELPPLELGAA